MSSVEWYFADGSCWIALDTLAQLHIENLWWRNYSTWVQCKHFKSPVYVDISQLILFYKDKPFYLTRRINKLSAYV
ncbi:hypothetical protein BDB01DRAFT_713833 [Pilobolus umbonatus]|nr:hypothetical protein BDB01DRAFT_713833 [Pilobolus umbonatus]